MYAVLKGIVWTCHLYIGWFAVLWLICTIQTMIFWYVQGEKLKCWLCLIPGFTTMCNFCYATGSFLGLPGFVLFWVQLITWDPICTVLYIMYLIAVNVLFVRVEFPTAKSYLAVVGIYKYICMWKEVRECLNTRKAKTTKKKTMASKTRRQNTTRKMPS